MGFQTVTRASCCLGVLASCWVLGKWYPWHWHPLMVNGLWLLWQSQSYQEWQRHLGGKIVFFRYFLFFTAWPSMCANGECLGYCLYDFSLFWRVYWNSIHVIYTATIHITCDLKALSMCSNLNSVDNILQLIPQLISLISLKVFWKPSIHPSWTNMQ